jgi:5-methylcytosine-specific restriction endonuclease McrA
MLRRKTPLKAKAGFKKSGGKLNAFSKRRRDEYKIYKVARELYLNKHPNCEVCGNVAMDIHHKAKRGKNLSNMETFMAVCRICHNRIHDNPAWARENNYLIYDHK